MRNELTIELDNHIADSNEIDSTKLELTMKITCFLAVAVEPLFTFFLAEQTNFSINQLIKAFLTESPPEIIGKFVTALAITCASIDLICDTICVNPARDAADLVRVMNKEDVLKNKTIKKIMTMSLSLIAVTCSFPIGAALSAIPVAQMAASISNHWLRSLVEDGSLVILSLLGILYYTMFNQAKIKKHVDDFVETLKDLPPFTRKVKKNLLGFLEVLIQTCSNSSYRGIAFAFYMSAIIAEILHLNNSTDIAKLFITISGVSTVLVTLFTRTLSTSNAIMNDKFNFLSQAEINKASGIAAGTITDAILSVLRGGSLVVLSWSKYSGPLFAKLLCSALLGGATLMHSFYVRCMVRKKENALSELSNEELKKRSINIDETSALLLKQSFSDNSNIRKAKLFDDLSATIQLDSVLIWFIFIINFISRFTRLISFYGFSNQLSQTMKWGLSKYDNLAVTCSAGGEVTKNDFSVYASSINDTIKCVATSWKLEKARDENSQSNTWCRFFSRPFRSIWHASPYCYTMKELKDLNEKENNNISQP